MHADRCHTHEGLLSPSHALTGSHAPSPGSCPPVQGALLPDQHHSSLDRPLSISSAPNCSVPVLRLPDLSIGDPDRSRLDTATLPAYFYHTVSPISSQPARAPPPGSIDYSLPFHFHSGHSSPPHPSFPSSSASFLPSFLSSFLFFFFRTFPFCPPTVAFGLNYFQRRPRHRLSLSSLSYGLPSLLSLLGGPSACLFWAQPGID